MSDTATASLPVSQDPQQDTQNPLTNTTSVSQVSDPVNQNIPSQNTPAAVSPQQGDQSVTIATSSPSTPVEPTQPLPPQVPPQISAAPGGNKERQGSSIAVPEISISQPQEIEKSAEVPPELESWMEEVQHHEEMLPKEIVIADENPTAEPTTNISDEPFIVLPVTQAGMQSGLKKSVTESARWLVTWCKRIIQKFHGHVVYRHTSAKENV